MTRILCMCFGNISRVGKTTRQLINADYDRYDLLIGMDRANLRDVCQIYGGDPDGKIHRLMEYTDRPADGFHPGDVANLWYTGDFEATWQDMLKGCQGLLKNIYPDKYVDGEKAQYGI